MADDGQLTPEKQLLKLIESGGGKTPAASGAQAATAPLKKLGGIFRGRFAFFKRTTGKQASSGKLRVDLAGVNRLLTVAVVILFVYVVYDAAASAMSLKTPPNFASPKEKTPGAGSSGMTSPLKEASFYQQKVTSRDIFKEGGKPVEKKQEKIETAEESEAAQSLSLVGISWSSNPDVIIEDKATQKTYFVKRGQMVGNGVKVEAIFKDHVVLSHEGQEFELR